MLTGKISHIASDIMVRVASMVRLPFSMWTSCYRVREIHRKLDSAFGHGLSDYEGVSGRARVIIICFQFHLYSCLDLQACGRVKKDWLILKVQYITSYISRQAEVGVASHGRTEDLDISSPAAIDQFADRRWW
jgi:hypothetical protein